MLKVEEIPNDLRKAFETLSCLKQVQILMIRKYKANKDLTPIIQWLESDLLPECDKSLETLECYIRRENQ